MRNHISEMCRKASWALLVGVVCGGAASCTDDYTLDDPDNYPSWLGSSIYEAMQHPEALTAGTGNVLEGTFNNYLRLIDDLGYGEILQKTGSKTIFAANDEAFDRFYADNAWGVRKYEDLTTAMKLQLLKGSMLDNAILVEMLSNISDGSTAVMQGQALKHITGANVIDTITYMRGRADMPVNNSYWEKYYDGGIYIVMDATRPMMVHFTEEQMTQNNITTKGTGSDFEVITGQPYDEAEHSAYVFRNKIIRSDVTCKNGYIHQMQDVLVPPGNMAELIRTNGESNLFSRMLDRFSAPYEDASTTKLYKDWYEEQQQAGIDMSGTSNPDIIYQKRYASGRTESNTTDSRNGVLQNDPNGIEFPYPLPYDPGWNNYNNGTTGENPLKDIAAMFVPTDEAVRQYFLPGGEGEFLINSFGKKPNTLENLEENIDSIPLQNVQQIIKNLMQDSFVASVPSKFGRVMDEANDPMGLSLDVLARNSNGSYDVKIANNGVIYMLNKVFAPPSLIAVSAPVTLIDNMKIMNVAVNDGQTNYTPLQLNLNYYAYLLAMSANYGFFIPTDEAFGKYYIDPAYLNADQPRALRFYYQKRSPYVYCSAWKYDPKTGVVGTTAADSLGTVTSADFRSQFIDILNYHTVVLGDGEEMGANRFYKTKHGGAIEFGNGTVRSGAQIEGLTPVSNITTVYNQANGTAYAVDNIIQAPQTSVLDVLEGNENFSEFLTLCTDMDMDSIMEFASDKLVEVNTVTQKKRMDAYHTFAAKGGLTDNVNYFNSYNYTVYAPDNDAMREAYQRGLPRWSDIKAIYDEYNERLDAEKTAGQVSDEVQQARDKALVMVEEINSFIRYHFQDNSVFADNTIETGIFPTACSDTLGIREKIRVSGGNGRIVITDKNGNNITIDAADANKLSNKMTRDYVIQVKGSGRTENRSISTSSFAVVHQISQPLSTHAGTDRYDAAWTGTGAQARLKAFRRLFEEKLYKRY